MTREEEVGMLPPFTINCSDQRALTRWSVDFSFAFTTGRLEAGVRFAATLGAARVVPFVVDGLDDTKGELSPISP
jgi:hypothetical protein